jgi:chromosome segregation ATPase
MTKAELIEHIEDLVETMAGLIAERDEYRQRAVALEDDLFVITKQRDRLKADEQDILERIAEMSEENIKLREALERLIDKIGKDEWFASWAAEARAVLQEVDR